MIGCCNVNYEEYDLISVFGSKVGAEELAEIKTSLDNQWLGIGPKTKAFEADFAKKIGAADFALLNSGSNSLFLAVKLLDLPPNSEVIVPSFTWIACAHAVVVAGHRPIFCDVDLETQNVTIETVRPFITAKTKAIMVVHYAGKPVDIAPLLKLGIPIIEDAAHAVDSKYNGKHCGTIGDVGIFSFDAVKNLTMGEGGGLTSGNPEIVAKARTLRYCGIGKSGFEASASRDRWWEYQILDFLPKFLPNDILASIGLAQLRKLDTLQAIRKKIWGVYQKEFAVVDWIKRPADPAPSEQHSYFTYFIRVPAKNRDAFAKYLYDNGIYATLRYHPLHLNPIYKSTSKLPVSERLNDEGLNVPLHPNLSDGDVDKVLTTIRAFSKKL